MSATTPVQGQGIGHGENGVGGVVGIGSTPQSSNSALGAIAGAGAATVERPTVERPVREITPIEWGKILKVTLIFLLVVGFAVGLVAVATKGFTDLGSSGHQYAGGGL